LSATQPTHAAPQLLQRKHGCCSASSPLCSTDRLRAHATRATDTQGGPTPRIQGTATRTPTVLHNLCTHTDHMRDHLRTVPRLLLQYPRPPLSPTPLLPACHPLPPTTGNRCASSLRQLPTRHTCMDILLAAAAAALTSAAAGCGVPGCACGCRCCPLLLPRPLRLPHHVVKDSPQPQAPLELGFTKMNSDLRHSKQVDGSASGESAACSHLEGPASCPLSCNTPSQPM
jgi:hypothetical protein